MNPSNLPTYTPDDSFCDEEIVVVQPTDPDEDRLKEATSPSPESTTAFCLNQYFNSSGIKIENDNCHLKPNSTILTSDIMKNRLKAKQNVKKPNLHQQSISSNPNLESLLLDSLDTDDFVGIENDHTSTATALPLSFSTPPPCLSSNPLPDCSTGGVNSMTQPPSDTPTTTEPVSSDQPKLPTTTTSSLAGFGDLNSIFQSLPSLNPLVAAIMVNCATMNMINQLIPLLQTITGLSSNLTSSLIDQIVTPNSFTNVLQSATIANGSLPTKTNNKTGTTDHCSDDPGLLVTSSAKPTVNTNHRSDDVVVIDDSGNEDDASDSILLHNGEGVNKQNITRPLNTNRSLRSSSFAIDQTPSIRQAITHVGGNDQRKRGVDHPLMTPSGDIRHYKYQRLSTRQNNNKRRDTIMLQQQHEAERCDGEIDQNVVNNVNDKDANGSPKIREDNDNKGDDSSKTTEPSPDALPILICKVVGCGLRFSSVRDLFHHKSTCHGRGSKSQPIFTDPFRRHECPYVDCTKAYSKPNKLKEHIRTHTGERPYVCKVPGCGAAFIRLYGVRRHEYSHLFGRQSHSDHVNTTTTQSTIANPTSGLALNGARNLLNADRQEDKDKETSEIINNNDDCVIVERTSPTQTSLDKLGGTNRPYPTIAPKSGLGQLRPLSPLGVSSSPHKPHICPYTTCRKAFTKVNKLREHICRHTGLRPYKCDQCPAGFVRLYDLRRHSTIHARRAHLRQQQAHSFPPRPLVPRGVPVRDALTNTYGSVNSTSADQPLSSTAQSHLHCPTNYANRSSSSPTLTIVEIDSSSNHSGTNMDLSSIANGQSINV